MSARWLPSSSFTARPVRLTFYEFIGWIEGSAFDRCWAGVLSDATGDWLRLTPGPQLDERGAYREPTVERMLAASIAAGTARVLRVTEYAGEPATSLVPVPAV